MVLRMVLRIMRLGRIKTQNKTVIDYDLCQNRLKSEPEEQNKSNVASKYFKSLIIINPNQRSKILRISSLHTNGLLSVNYFQSRKDS